MGRTREDCGVVWPSAGRPEVGQCVQRIDDGPDLAGECNGLDTLDEKFLGLSELAQLAGAHAEDVEGSAGTAPVAAPSQCRQALLHQPRSVLAAQPREVGEPTNRALLQTPPLKLTQCRLVRI
jgi:hypothetical protein